MPYSSIAPSFWASPAHLASYNDQRFGAVGKYGSIAVIERLMRTIKTECTRQLMVPYQRPQLRRELSLFMDWYNAHRPHDGLDGCVPDEVYFGLDPAMLAPRYEPRERWPRGSPCAAPTTRVRRIDRAPLLY